MIAELCGLAVDARAAARTRDLKELAKSSRWIAANALAIRGRRLVVRDRLPTVPCVLHVRVSRLGELVAAVAAMPSLVDGADLPASWRVALRVIGLPMLDDLTSAALAAGASVLTVADGAGWTIEVADHGRAYVARVRGVRQQLAA